MKNQHLVIILVAFITVIVSLYFGITIYNIEDNIHINHLLEDEGQSIRFPEEIPTLGYKAAIITCIFLMIGFEKDYPLSFGVGFQVLGSLNGESNVLRFGVTLSGDIPFLVW